MRIILISKIRAVQRETIITVLLVILGAVLAFVLFATGALWRSKSPVDGHKASFVVPAEKNQSRIEEQRISEAGRPMRVHEGIRRTLFAASMCGKVHS